MYTFAIDLSPPLFREVKEAERKKYIDELGSYQKPWTLIDKNIASVLLSARITKLNS